MGKKKERQEKVKRAIEEGEEITVQLEKDWNLKGILVEQQDDQCIIFTEEGFTVFIPDREIKAIWLKEELIENGTSKKD